MHRYPLKRVIEHYHTLLFLLLMSSIAKGYIQESSGQRIAKDGQFPFIVSIIYSNELICGGGLVAQQAVVTGARCCERIEDKRKARVSAGSLQPFSEEAHVRDVVKIGFASSFKNKSVSWTPDLCLLILEQDLPQTETISIAVLDQGTNNHCTLISWAENLQLTYQNVNAQNNASILCSEADCRDGSLILCENKLRAVYDPTTSQFIRLAPFTSWIHQSIRESQSDVNKRNHMAAFLISTFIPLILSLIIQ